jgi:hypothetical protein
VTRLTGLLSMAHMARHNDYRDAIQFFCPDASPYLTGRTVVMDGERSIADLVTAPTHRRHH